MWTLTLRGIPPQRLPAAAAAARYALAQDGTEAHYAVAATDDGTLTVTGPSPLLLTHMTPSLCSGMPFTQLLIQQGED